jgi:hypothetical protein
MGSARLRAHYRFEGNDRRDLNTAGGDFFSHSPLRNQVRLAFSHPFGATCTLEWRADYRHSYFRDPNRFDDGGPVTKRRVEQLTLAGLQLRTRTRAAWDWLLEYQYSHNRSTLEEFEYDRHLLLVGLEWLH